MEFIYVTKSNVNPIKRMEANNILKHSFLANWKTKRKLIARFYRELKVSRSYYNIKTLFYDKFNEKNITTY